MIIRKQGERFQKGVSSHVDGTLRLDYGGVEREESRKTPGI